MKHLLHHILTVAMLAGLLSSAPAQAQVSVRKTAASVPVMILSSDSRTVSYGHHFVNLYVTTNTDFTATVAESAAGWLSIAKVEDGCVTLEVATNYGESARTGAVTLTSAGGKLTKTFNLTQSREAFVEELQEGSVKPTSCSDNNHQDNGCTATATIDGDLSTIYHSRWNGSPVTESNPAILTYNFNDAHIDYINYIPRPVGDNGNFGALKLYIKYTGQSDYTLYGNYDFGFASTPSSILLGAEGTDHIASLRFEVLSGVGQLASCSEMQFRTYMQSPDIQNIFGNAMLTTLADGVTDADIAAMQNPALRILAQGIKDGTYDTQWRVSRHKCLLTPSILGELWCSGKNYDVTQGVTGIMITPGTTLVAVEGLDNECASLEVYGWTVPEGSTFRRASYSLHNGLNAINHTADWNGLAYISYFRSDPENHPDIQVHIVNGIQNGVLSTALSNDEMDRMLAATPYTTIDLLGERVHSVWESTALRRYASGKYRQYINVLDTLIAWQHQLLGFEKYGRVPDNVTLAYVNYDYYMYQGGLGVSFKYDTQNRCCNPTNIIKSDDDVVWGLSHEWGHQHQMSPYFCWAGMTEVTNNMNSCYNVLHMGYKGTRINNGWTAAKKKFINGDPEAGKTSERRQAAYAVASSFGWSSDIKAKYLEMADATIASRSSDPAKSLHINECEVEEILAPLFMIHCYFTENLGMRDFTPDLYESLRHTDTDDDKYAMCAAAQNGRADRYEALKAAYPNSCWIKQNYVTANSTRWQNSSAYIFNYVRKASRLAGYNLWPFYEKWGFFRQVALSIGDYGTKYLCITKAMYDEFKADMDALVEDGTLKPMTDEMVDAISVASIPQFSTPDIPN